MLNDGFSLDSENRVIAYIALSDRAMLRLSQTLTPAHFVDEFCRDCFVTLRDAWMANPDRFDPCVVETLREKHPRVIGDFARIINDCPIGKDLPSRWRYHENVLHECLIVRGVQWVGAQLVDVETKDDPIAFYKQTIDTFERRRHLLDTETPKFSDQAFAFLERRLEPDAVALSTGHAIWDELGCIRVEGNAILAGTPGTGKTAMAIQTCVSAARRGLSVAYFSLEMSDDEILERIFITGLGCVKTQISSSDSRTAELITCLSTKFHLFGARGRMTVRDISAQIKQLQSESRVDIVVVDHMGLLISTNPKGSRYEQVSEISRDLKLMTSERRVALINLCQLNRSAGDEAPQMKNLRDSGRIEEDATSITFLYRPKDREDETVDVLIRKNRHGKVTSRTGIGFDKSIQTFIYDDPEMIFD